MGRGRRSLLASTLLTWEHCMTPGWNREVAPRLGGRRLVSVSHVCNSGSSPALLFEETSDDAHKTTPPSKIGVSVSTFLTFIITLFSSVSFPMPSDIHDPFRDVASMNICFCLSHLGKRLLLLLPG